MNPRMTSKAKVSLNDFWLDGCVGHTDSLGRDLGKLFLKCLFEKETRSKFHEISVMSHFYEHGTFSIYRNLIKRVPDYLGKDPLSKRKKLHGHLHRNYALDKNHLNVWYTPENLRPPLDEPFNIFLSHDLDDYDGRNIYLPIWATRLGLNIQESNTFQDSLISKRSTTVSGKKGICAIISNPEPIRMAFLNELKKYFAVDIYGAFGLPVTDKANILKNYKVNICFENDEYPGYVTEKPFEAWLGGCIPVWRGLDSGGYINDQAIVDVTHLGFRESISRIKSIMNSNEEYVRISGLPILKKKYDYQKLIYMVENLQSI